ncbi:response regulator [Chlorogloeopsis fritschii PCC 9212]|uniref:Response regulator n=1 Tax=Chlorogloeopsis fritschii PCC 6912 TaxID=211165 RepID=A0A3S0Y1W9_CHLFR|nr:response regulator [Chlorogloeopsis fritschii]RUR86561.1 response regulator [Chlorogloeopsis fritschii PCC 6912]
MDKPAYTVLVAEDNPGDVLLVRRTLLKANFSHVLQIVVDGEAAIAYLAGEGDYADRARFPLPSLLLLDLKMPRKSGFDVLEWLQQQMVPRLAVVVLTTSTKNEDIERAYALGAKAYLVKPITLERFMKALETLELS